MKVFDKKTQTYKEVRIKPGGDTLPIGTIVEYDGTTVPEGYEEVTKDFVKGYNEDLNNISKTGVVYADTTATNKPGANGYCITLAVNQNYRKQIYYVQNVQNNSYVRTYENGTWTEWLQTK